LQDYQARLQELRNALQLSDAHKRQIGDRANGIESDLSEVRRLLSDLQSDMADAADLATRPQLVTDFLGYNARPSPSQPNYPWKLNPHSAPNWVKDLMLDCQVQVHQPNGTLTIELAGGVDKHQAMFNLATGQCTLTSTRFPEPNGKGAELAKQEAVTTLKGPGTYRVRFANFDDRVTLWVDGRLPFGDGVAYEAVPANLRGPRIADLQPVRIGANTTNVTVRKLQVWRDIYYTGTASGSDISLGFAEDTAIGVAQFLSLSANERKGLAEHATVEKWNPYYHLTGVNYPRVDEQHPDGRLGADEYFALGDNSTQSSDSRAWGPVPNRLLLGKAVFVYWPITRFGVIW
jgi:signal peptidase I